MSANPSPSGPLEVVHAFIQAALVDRDEARAKSLLTRASVEQGQFSGPPPGQEVRAEIGEATQEGGEWTVPVTMSDPNDASQAPTMLFTPVQEDGQWKLDMNRMMERMFGGQMEEVMETMADAMKGVGEAMAEGMTQAFGGLGEALSGAFGAAESANLDKLPEDGPPAMAEVFTQFYEKDLPDQLNLMREAVGSEIEFHVDWHTFEGDVEAAKRLPRKVLSNVRSAVCLLSSDDAVRDAMREKLREIVVFHVGYAQGKAVHLEGGRLQVTVSLSDAEAEGGIGHHSAGEISAAIREGLDADKGPAIERLTEEVLPALVDQIREHLDLDIEVTLDPAGFTQGYDTETAVANLKRLEDEVLRNFVYVLREVKAKSPLGMIGGIRLEHAASARQRVMYIEGSKLVMRLCFVEPEGAYDAAELERLLPGVVAGAPDYSDRASKGEYGGEAPAGDDAFARIGAYRDQNMAELSPDIQNAVGKGLDIEIDWASIGDDAEAAEQLRWWGLNRIHGAIRFIAQHADVQQDLMDSLTGIRLICVQSPSGKAIELAGGVLTVTVCLSEGEQGCFYERDIADAIVASLGTELRPIIAALRDSAAEWEKRLLEEHGATVQYFIDFAGFTSSPDDQQNRFALSQLGEHGIDVLYHAVTALFDTNPNFKQQFTQRVRQFSVMHTPEPELKGLEFYTDAIVYRLYLHQGYQGYLTIDAMKKKLPAIVAQMTDVVVDEGGDEGVMSIGDETGVGVEPAVTTELAELIELTDRGAGDGDDDAVFDRDGDSRGLKEGLEEARDAAAGADTFEQMRAQFEQMLPTLSQQFVGVVGKPISIDIDYDSLEGDAMALERMVNLCLSPLMDGMMTAGQDSAYRDGLAQAIDRIMLRRVASRDDQSMWLDRGELTMTACLEGEDAILAPEQAAAILKAIIDHLREAKPAATKKTAKEKATKEKASPTTSTSDEATPATPTGKEKPAQKVKPGAKKAKKASPKSQAKAPKPAKKTKKKQ